jgi:hypothetical protein
VLVARSILYVGDQAPSLPATIKDGNNNIIDLTGYTSVTFAMRQAFDTTNKWETAAVFVAPRTAGTVRYDLGSSDLSTLVPGVYVGQWTLFDASSRPQHVDAGEFEVRTGF